MLQRFSAALTHKGRGIAVTITANPRVSLDTTGRGLFLLRCSFAATALLVYGHTVANKIESSIPVSDRRVAIEGRYAPQRDNSGEPFVRIGYPGVTLHLASIGGDVSLHCGATSENVYLDISIDSGEFRRVHLERGEQLVPLSEGLEKPHRITVVKRNESWQGLLDVYGLKTRGGDLSPPESLPERRLLFIGDSITCGAVADVRPDDPENGPHNCNGRQSFGWQLARLLDAQCHLVSYGGRGALRDWEGKRTPEQRNAPEFYPLGLPDDPSSAWDAATYVPDAVLICLGTNDFHAGAPPREEFVEAYLKLISAVRADAPEALVLLLDSPMFGKTKKREQLASMLDEVVARSGNPRVEHFPLGYYVDRPGNKHPRADEHLQIARDLEPILRDRLGW